MVSGKETPEHILKQIRRLKRQTRLSLREIAKAAGVHITVVNRALDTLPGEDDEEPRGRRTTLAGRGPLAPPQTPSAAKVANHADKAAKSRDATPPDAVVDSGDYDALGLGGDELSLGE